MTRIWGRLKSGLVGVGNRFIEARTGLIPTSSTTEQDVFVVGYPKSGNTWVQNLIAGVAFGIDPGETPDSVVQDLVPDVHKRRYFKRYGQPTFFKSHRLPREAYRGVVYLVRDGRDVVVSYWHYYNGLRRTHIGIEDFLSKPVWPGPWETHVRAWLSNPYQADLLVVKYEDLLADCVLQLQRICDFAGLNVSKAQLERVAAQASFNRLQRKEQETGMDDPSWDSSSASFFRRGQSGSHRTELPGQVLQKCVEAQRATLELCGYL